MATWPQIVVIVIIALRGVADARRFSKDASVGVPAAIIGEIIWTGAAVLVLWRGGFWTSLGWPA